MDGCDTDTLGTLYTSEKTIAIVTDRWWPQAAKRARKSDKLSVFL